MTAPKRIQRKRTKGWRMPEGAIYVGRPGKWGNPYSVTCLTDAAAAVEMYRGLIERVAVGRKECEHTDGMGVWDRQIYRHIRDDLRGKDLACWCPLDQRCHADVLLELANGSKR